MKNMEVSEVMAKLEEWGNPGTKKVLIKHGAREPFFGVKVADLKKIVKKVKKDYDLSIALYETGNSDAMYLAGLLSDETKLTREDLQNWVENAYWYMLSEYAVAWSAAETPFAEEMADKWIESDEEHIAAAGWSTWASIVMITPDEELDLKKLQELMKRAEANLKDGENRVSYAKNGFIIAVGASVKALTKDAIDAGKRIGKVKVNMGETSCKVPYIPEYLKKIESKGRIGQKRKTAKC